MWNLSYNHFKLVTFLYSHIDPHMLRTILLLVPIESVDQVNFTIAYFYVAWEDLPPEPYGLWVT